MLRRTALRARGARPRGDQPRPRRARVRRARAATSTGCSSAPAPPASTPATASGATTPSTRTACWWRSPSAARARTSTGSPRLGARARRARAGRHRRLAHERARATRAAASDAVTIFERSRAGPPGLRGARARRARGAGRGAAAGRAAPRASPPRCRRSPSPRSCATTRPLVEELPPRRGFYPLGSCTMKHNPKLHERVAALPGHARLHPLQDPRVRPGRARADVATCRGRSPRSPGCRTSRCSRAPARTASWPACC